MPVVLGYDPASQVAGWAVAIDGVPHQIGIWKPSKKSLPPLARLLEWDGFSRILIASFKPDVVTMEVIRVSNSHDTTRSMSRFESVMLVNAGSAGCEIVEYQVGQSRLVYFGEGHGNVSKEDAYVRMRMMFPQLDWLPQDEGGMDQSDALVGALSYPKIKDRQRAVKEEKKVKAKRRRDKKQQQSQ